MILGMELKRDRFQKHVRRYTLKNDESFWDGIHKTKMYFFTTSIRLSELNTYSSVPYTSIVGNLIYVVACIRLGLA